MVNLLFVSTALLISCSTRVSIAPPPAIPQPKTSPIHSDLNHHILQAFVIESQKGSFDEAQQEWKKAIVLSYCDPEIHLAYGDMAHRYDKKEVAIKEWERAILCIGWKDQQRRQFIQQKITTVQQQDQDLQE